MSKDKIDVFLSDIYVRHGEQEGNKIVARMERSEICRKCHEEYKAKYPNQPFMIDCEGVYDEPDFQEIQKAATVEGEEPIPLDDIREMYNPSFWALNHIVVKNQYGDMASFEARWYQDWMLRCTAKRKVARCGRGLGKTTIAVIKELHKTTFNKNLETLIVCPQDPQSDKWYNEINLQIENSPSLASSKQSSKQRPFKFFKFYNGATISIFTAGSSSGRGANSIRSQSPRRVVLEEQDYLNEKDYEAINPLLTRYAESEFSGASTPSGSQSTFYVHCKQSPDIKEFHFPIWVHPEWSERMEADCRKKARTEAVYIREYLAEFGDPEAGLFRGAFIDAARQGYNYRTCKPDPKKSYFFGIDWNGDGTGTRIRIVEYDPDTQVRRCVQAITIDSPGRTTMDSINMIRDLNRKWRPVDIYCDKGFGFVQDELIRLVGAKREQPEDAALLKVKFIEFAANLTTNALVPKRDRWEAYKGEDEQDRRTKPFMVEGAIMAFENHLVEFSDQDILLDEQLRAYRVKTWGTNSQPASFEADCKSGDHDLDAFMLALMAVEMRYGLFQTKEAERRISQINHVTSFGVYETLDPRVQVLDPHEQKRQKLGVPSRVQPAKTGDISISFPLRGGAYVAPTNRSTPGSTSRTSAFRGRSPRNKGPR